MSYMPISLSTKHHIDHLNCQITHYVIIMAIIQSLILSFLLLHRTAYAATLPVVSRSRQCPIVLQNDIPLLRTDRILRADQFRPRQSSRLDLDESPRIVGGDFTTSSRLNDMLVALTDGQFFCTGTLISSRWVISAAHCRFDSTWTAAIGASQAGVDGNVIPVQRAFNHPKYRPDFEHFDIAVLKLQRPALGAAFMRLNVNATTPLENSFVRVAGYGTIVYDDEENEAERGRLRQVDLPVFNFQRCNRLFGGLISRAQFCTGYPLGGCDACSGDSGGPVFQYDSNGDPVLIGLVSFGDGCGNANSPGVNVRVSHFEEWLRRKGADFEVSTDAQPVYAEIPTRVPK